MGQWLSNLFLVIFLIFLKMSATALGIYLLWTILADKFSFVTISFPEALVIAGSLMLITLTFKIKTKEEEEEL